MAKHYVLALLCIMAQIMFNPAWAEVTSPTTVTSTTSQDAIQTFVKSDFATRRAMLNQWPASIEQLDQLVAYIDQNELYTDSSGNTYILKNDEKLLSYKDYVVRDNIESLKGNWNQLFKNDNPIHAEFGTGRGKFLTTLAKQNPDINYIAFEIKEEVLYLITKI